MRRCDMSVITLNILLYYRYGTVLNFELYRRDYIILYVDTVRAIVQREDTSRPFVVSSPSNGKESEEEGYIAKNPYDDLYGDSKLITLI
jgi:beta-mannosidase